MWFSGFLSFENMFHAMHHYLKTVRSYFRLYVAKVKESLKLFIINELVLFDLPFGIFEYFDWKFNFKLTSYDFVNL